MHSIRNWILTGVTLAFWSPAFGQQPYWGNETDEARQLEETYSHKRQSMGTARHAMVAACHRLSVDIGLSVLKRGGNAVDAFVAVTLADYVQSPGASSIAGPLGALIFDARSGSVESLMAPLRTVADPSGQTTVGETSLGKQVLIPGAIAGLELMHRKRGKLPWRELVEPARRLAADGFEVDPLFEAILTNYKSVIARTEYGRATYLHPDGSPLVKGEILKLPAVAATLKEIAKHGASYMYKGAWAAQAVASINKEGGRATASDFTSYRATLGRPLQTKYRLYDVYGLGAPDSGGLRLLLALKALEPTDLKSLGHYSESIAALETLIRTVTAVNSEPQLYQHEFFADSSGAQKLLDSARAEAIWRDVQEKVASTPSAPAGSHSYSVAIVDAKGNAVAGNHTIESLPFGAGIFVGGVPLNNAGLVHPWQEGVAYSTPPGSYLVEPLSATMAFKDKQLVLASSTFSGSLWPADLQLVTSVLDFDWSPERIALTPRFGNYATDYTTMTVDVSKLMIDKRYARTLVDQLARRGISVSQDGYIDTGMLVLIKRDPKTGALTGFTPEQLPDGKAAGY